MRKIFAVIEIDEEKAQAMDSDYAPGSYLEREFGWLEDSGIILRDWYVSDEDDVLPWCRYIDYLVEWALDNHYIDDDNDIQEPPSYNEWKEVFDLFHGREL